MNRKLLYNMKLPFFSRNYDPRRSAPRIGHLHLCCPANLPRRESTLLKPLAIVNVWRPFHTRDTMQPMSFEVYSSKKPATTTRAWASAFGLFLGVTALAWSMGTGQLDRNLGVIESPPEWGFSYRPPKAFKMMDIKKFPGGTIRRYESGQGASRLVFSVWRFDEVKNLTPARACDLVLQASSGLSSHALIAARTTPRDERVGRFRAKEVESPALAMVVRAAVTEESAVAFALNGLEPGALRQGYAAFDLSCRSTKFSGD